MVGSIVCEKVRLEYAETLCVAQVSGYPFFTRTWMEGKRDERSDLMVDYELLLVGFAIDCFSILYLSFYGDMCVDPICMNDDW